VAQGLARALGCKVADLDQQAVQAGAATLLIGLTSGGRQLGSLRPAPAPKPQPPTAAELATVPAALADEESDGLPF
jgi:hypothetical protein